MLNPNLPFKSKKILVKTSKSKLLVMTEKYSFVNKLFLPINISDFSLFFMQKLQLPPYLEKEHPIS